VEHGDGLRETEDRKYRMVRPIMRSPSAIWLFRRLHPDWATRLATGSSNASRTYAARDGGAGLRAIGLTRLASEPDLNVVVYGHSHVAALERVGDNQVFANAGSWLDAPTYIEITDSSIALLKWNGSAERDSLHVIDR
jgi:UDP-2,3-diacylglucosamine hydrolase